MNKTFRPSVRSKLCASRGPGRTSRQTKDLGKERNADGVQWRFSSGDPTSSSSSSSAPCPQSQPP
eukprot:5880389-Prymnesium_polylepis.1